MLTDCQGPFKSFEDAQLSGAQLPFLERGASLRGASPLAGVTTATVSGTPVELLSGCAETGEHSVLIEEARRLVEQEGADAIVGGAGVAFREVARLYPEVPFVATFWDDSEVTLRNAPANVYRYTIDYTQQAAGLGRYAYEQLGWRRASAIAGDGPGGWHAVAAFTAEFCALGGQVEPVYRDPFAPKPGIGRAALVGDPDGVAVFLTFFDAPGEVLPELVDGVERPARELLLWAPLLEEPATLTALGRRLDGVVSTSWFPAGPPSKAATEYGQRHAAAFPGLQEGIGWASFVLGYHDSVEALLTALEHVNGDVSDGRRGLREALATLELELPRGRVRLDGNRQAVADVPLVRLTVNGGAIGYEPAGAARGVEQSFGGLLSKAPPPGPRSQPCRVARPPTWAR